MVRALRACLAVCLAVVWLVACASDDGGSPSPSSDPGAGESSTTVAAGAPLGEVMLSAEDLPADLVAAEAVDDTITSFCAAEDATAGLRATDREVRGFSRPEGGASVIQLAFRFADDGAATFVEQARRALERCSSVPDISGLAFEYEPLAPALEAPFAGVADDQVGRYGTSVGSGNLTIDAVVFHRGDVGVLLAVLGLDLPRAELDALAQTAFGAVAAKLAG